MIFVLGMMQSLSEITCYDPVQWNVPFWPFSRFSFPSFSMPSFFQFRVELLSYRALKQFNVCKNFLSSINSFVRFFWFLTFASRYFSKFNKKIWTECKWKRTLSFAKGTVNRQFHFFQLWIWLENLVQILLLTSFCVVFFIDLFASILQLSDFRFFFELFQPPFRNLRACLGTEVSFLLKWNRIQIFLSDVAVGFLINLSHSDLS